MGLRSTDQSKPQTQAQRRAGSLTPAALIVTRVRRKIKEEINMTIFSYFVTVIGAAGA